jgi:hypothetical protein
VIRGARSSFNSSLIILHSSLLLCPWPRAALPSNLASIMPLGTAGTLDKSVLSIALAKEDLLPIAIATDGVFSVASAEENDLSEVPSGATSRPFKLFYSLPQFTTTSQLKFFFI